MLKGKGGEKGVIKHFARFTEGFPLAKQEDSKGADEEIHGGCRERRWWVLWLRGQSRKERRQKRRN